MDIKKTKDIEWSGCKPFWPGNPKARFPIKHYLYADEFRRLVPDAETFTRLWPDLRFAYKDVSFPENYEKVPQHLQRLDVAPSIS